MTKTDRIANTSSDSDASGPSRPGVSLRFDFVDAPSHLACVGFSHPKEIIVTHKVDEIRRAMEAVEAGLGRGLHAAGFVSYEAAPGFDAALTTKSPGDVPLVWFGLFEAPEIVPALGRGKIDDASEPHAQAASWASDISPDAYRTGVDAVRQAILDGDSYQANFTFRLHASIDPAGAPALYHRLARDQRAPYAAFLDIGAWQILSLSPELFFRIDEGVITTKPMKGTTTRGAWAEEDSRRAQWLRTSEKNRAENVMIVDLARNDVGKIADIGSVRATTLFDIERYPSLWHMVSTVEGRLRPDTTLLDVFTALFPAGSITGAPKSSSMRLIRAIEHAPRGLYCGAIGFASPDGHAMFNVAIRTITIDTRRSEAEFGIGGGITWDSRSDDEYAEALAKAACLIPEPDFELLETMRLEQGVYVRRQGHLDRLRDSAHYFDRPYDQTSVAEALEAHAREHPIETRRARLCLDRAGIAIVTSEPFVPTTAGPHPIALATSPVSRVDRFLYHKTTRRQVYDAHRAAHPQALDVLLWNEDGELTEFTIGNLVAEIDGQRWTPPRAGGLLGGVFRAELLASGAIRERVLTREDLVQATRVWLISSLREWVPVWLVASEKAMRNRPAR